MKPRIIILGAGFGGLEIATILSEQMGDGLDIKLIDKHDSFYFGFSKLDVMFGRMPADQARHAYARIAKPGLTFIRETVTAIDPVRKQVTTSQGIHEADVMVIAMGADLEVSATPGLSTGGDEFYSMEGAERLREKLPAFNSGHAIVGVCSAPFKCPPAPSEAALMLHDHLVARGIRSNCEISLVIPFGLPVPPSPETSEVLLRSFAERNIRFIPNRRVTSIDPDRKSASLDDGTELPFDLFLGIPKHVAPAVVQQSGLTDNGWIAVDRKNLMTKFPDVYAVGDITSVGTPKAGVFAEGAARVAAASILAKLAGREHEDPYTGAGSCYLEFGEGKVARVDVDFFSGPKPFGVHNEASVAITAEKTIFGSSRVSRWFGD